MTETPFDSDIEDSSFPPAAGLSYEEARAELEETVRILEAGQMSLDDSLKYWERGQSLARRCEELLDGATQRVEKTLQRSHNTQAAPEHEEADNDGAEG